MECFSSGGSPTLSRYRDLSKSIRSRSLTRALQHEMLRGLPNLGRMLDVGGGATAEYLPLIKYDHYDSINIDPAIEPTWIVNAGDAFPAESEAFDTVLSMNTLEHVFEPVFVIDEMCRVLKPGGALAISTPFLFPIHGHPDDFFRPTPSWYRQVLERAGFHQVEIVPLAWGPRSTGLTCGGSIRFGAGLRKQYALLFDLLEAKLRSLVGKPPNAAYWNRLATAFFVRAKKPGQPSAL